MASGSSGASPSGGGQRHTFDIFVSSTSRDLIQGYRPAARRAIETLRQHPIMMEDFGAHDGDASSVSTGEVATADLVLLIVAWRYGYVPTGETRSVTHLEYQEARRLGKPVLVFLAAEETERNDALFPTAQRDPAHYKDVLAFRAELERDQVVAYFTTPADLERAITRALHTWLRGRPVGRVFPRVVPEAVRDFVGRETAVRQVLRALRGGQSAAISALVAGMGGVGKSALAREVLRQLAGDPTAFPGGIALVRCNEREGLPGLAWIYDQLLADWGVPLNPQEVAATQDDPKEAALTRERALRLRLRLADASGPLPALALLDNVEEQLPLGRALSALEQAGLTALVTTRTVPILPNVELLRLDVLEPGPAVALFAARYQEAGGQWDTARDAASTAQIIGLLGGLPLAIELAAADAALEGQGVAALAAQLAAHDRLDPLSDPTDPADPTDPTKTDPTKSVRVTFSRSFEKLSEPLRVAFAALGLPAGNDWPREVIEGMLAGMLAGVPGAPPPAEALKRLAARSLLTLASEPPPAGAAGATEGDTTPTPRVRLHPLLRDYASEQYDALPTERQLAILAALMRAVANFALAHDEPTAAAFAVLAREEPLIADTIRRAAEVHAAPQALIAAVNGLFYYIDVGGHWRLGETWRLRQLDALRKVGDRRGEGAALNNLGYLADSQGHYEEAGHYYEEALAIRRAMGDRGGEGVTLNNLGGLARGQGQLEEAARYYTEALAIQREVGDRRGEGATLNNLGALASGQGHYEEAARYYEEALAIRREVDDRAGEGVTLNNLGGLASGQGRLEEAAQYYTEALAIRREVGDRAGEATTLNNLGALARRQGEYEAAARYYEEALAIRREVGDRRGEATTLHNLGIVEETLGHRDKAEVYYQQSLAVYTELGLQDDIQDEVDALARLARAAEISRLPSNPVPAWPKPAAPPVEEPPAPTPPSAAPLVLPDAVAPPVETPTPPVEAPDALPDAEAPTGEPVPVGGGKPRRKWWPFGRG